MASFFSSAEWGQRHVCQCVVVDITRGGECGARCDARLWQASCLTGCALSRPLGLCPPSCPSDVKLGLPRASPDLPAFLLSQPPLLPHLPLGRIHPLYLSRGNLDETSVSRVLLLTLECAASDGCMSPGRAWLCSCRALKAAADPWLWYRLPHPALSRFSVSGKIRREGRPFTRC